ncbi:hypothetical protein BBUWI9123_0059 [Borreliella burgdorferi WI91-23]|nr:hypothetical protein BBUWI9123_0059 [Borreliella burgdorferi WI91-23]
MKYIKGLICYFEFNFIMDDDVLKDSVLSNLLQMKKKLGLRKY